VSKQQIGTLVRSENLSTVKLSMAVLQYKCATQQAIPHVLQASS